MEPENDEGNIEYKLKLINTDHTRIEELITQMRYRCEQGNGECIYNLGIKDSGEIEGLTDDEFNETIKNINIIASKNQYSVSTLKSTPVKDNKKIYEVLIRQINNNKYIDIKIAVAGSVDSGKCLDPKTMILLSDFTTKQVSDVSISDLLLGDDFKPRKILEIHTGFTEMYKINQSNGMTYIVTNNHLLSLIFTKPFVYSIDSLNNKYKIVYHTGNYKLECIDSYYPDGDIKNLKHVPLIDISVKDYIRQSLIWKKYFFGYKAFHLKNIKFDTDDDDDSITSYITVTPLGIGEYKGFTLDGNGRFLLRDYTVTHNSSTIGTLITGKKDDGRGLSRSSVFNYIHEHESGRTSSISHTIMGFDINGNVVSNEDKCWIDIINKSNKIISFFDLAGHEKYLKTTILGMSSLHPDMCFILISGNNGISNITKEHILLCVTLKIPFVIIISKMDLCADRKNVLQDTIISINKILKFPSVRRMGLHIKNKDDVLLAVKNIYSESIVPIFKTSNVTGHGLEALKYFLNIVSKKSVDNLNNEPVEFYIDNIFNVYGFGIVIGGHLLKGTINVGDKLLIGPIKNQYQNVIIKSIHCKKMSVQTISCGSYVCLGIKKKYNIKKGNVVIDNNNTKLLVKKFKATVNVVKSHSTTIKPGYEPVLHTGSIRETVKILSIENKSNYRNLENEQDDNILRSGDTAVVTFEFKYNYHFIKVNTRIILCESITKIVGNVTEIYSI